MLNTFQSNMLQIHIAQKRNLSMEAFIEKYAQKVRDLIDKGFESETDIDKLLDSDFAL